VNDAIKVNRTLSKTIDAATAAALDTAYEAFVQTLAESQLIATHFARDGGTFSVCIIYVP
jgi:hypothetical protein